MTMTEEQANRIYDVLVAHAGACDAEDYRRFYFVSALTDGCREYRFMGSLGFGGKLYVEPRGWRVGAYPEDMTPERAETVERTNAALAELYARRDEES